jgi:dihydropteroate synthase
MTLIVLGADHPSAEGAPPETLRRAAAELERLEVRITARSGLVLTECRQAPRLPARIDQALAVEAVLARDELVALLHEVQRRFASQSDSSPSRPLDITLVDASTLPQQAGALAALAEIAPDWREPRTGQSARDLLRRVGHGKIWRLRPTPLLMGIVNVTPDSFSDGGRFTTIDAAVAHAAALIEEGADIVDIGGESTRPGATPVPPEVERQRVLPVIRAIAPAARDRHRLVSIDTRHAATMECAIAAGATMVNDVTALKDPRSRHVVSAAGVPVVLMHMKGDPQSMQDDPAYTDVVAEVVASLREARDRAVADGIEPTRIWLDPGIGFGKTLLHNVALLRATSRLGKLGHRVLVGASRKGYGKRLMRETEAAERLGGSIAAALCVAERGAHALRVHDVAQTRQALAVWSAIEGSPSG